MFILPLVFIINALVFIMCLEERFKLYISAAASGVIFLFSLIFFGSIGNFYSFMIDNSISANMFNIILLLIMSVFTSSNNIIHKINVALTMHINFMLCTIVVPFLCSTGSFSMAGFLPISMTMIIYILLSLLTIAVFAGPMHHFFRNRINIYSISMTVVLLIASMNANGYLADMIDKYTFSVVFFSVLVPYLLVFFILRSNYAIARFKEKDFKRLNTKICSSILFDNVNSTLASVNTYKTLKNTIDYNFEKIYNMAELAGNTAIMNHVKNSSFSVALNPYLGKYSDDPYLNAIITNKKALSQTLGVDFVSNLEINSSDRRIRDLYVLINQMMEVAIENAQVVEENPFIHLSNYQSDIITSYEVSFSKKQEEVVKFDYKTYFTKENMQKLLKNSLEVLIHNFINDDKMTDDANFEFLADIVKKLDGSMKVMTARGKTSIKVNIKN